MKKNIHTRIREAWHQGISYWTLQVAVFPESDYPRAWNYSSNGGPPGCAMSFGRALRELGMIRDHRDNTMSRPTEQCKSDGRTRRA